ncbi:EncA/B family entericidin [Kaistia dalseonensis]|uniref:Small secreted protein n=1 Tax=Kaistia dalseonensis TaxID=410840 RepID=A0ABU0HCV4_9HYPH|nr:EncA/B family entericidin [Kaistia dalseonensis]MCX5497507.1 EncA/B family entericidin [Kaistia dalseonensis]MDQ0440146.1 putative small secreted protein [Kaistia dalseonensis]
MMTIRVSALVVAFIASAFLAGCANTVTGVSKDVKATGRAVERAVN